MDKVENPFPVVTYLGSDYFCDRVVGNGKVNGSDKKRPQHHAYRLAKNGENGSDSACF
jgi:hypothetical protein